MRTNAVKRLWREGGVAYGGWLTIPSAYSAEVVAHAGFDYVCVDMQHGMIGYQMAVEMLTAISTTGSTPFVRVPWNEPGIIGRMLDAGAMGVIIPMVNSAEEARAAVSACRYPPAGARSYGPGRVTLYAGDGYFAHANTEVACIPMVETAEALSNLESLLDVPGIDAVYFGPSDMSVSLGLAPSMWHDGGVWEDARRAVQAACERRGIIAGIHASAALAPRHVEAGYRMVTITSDAGAIAAGATADVRAVRGAPSSSAGESGVQP
jgi:4-hydroxy-2-oxoheptanedioate aldolase